MSGINVPLFADTQLTHSSTKRKISGIFIMHIAGKSVKLDFRDLQSTYTPLQLASLNGHLECIAALLERGASVDLRLS